MDDELHDVSLWKVVSLHQKNKESIVSGARHKLLSRLSYSQETSSNLVELSFGCAISKLEEPPIPAAQGSMATTLTTTSRLRSRG